MGCKCNLGFDDFGRNILRSSAESVGPSVDSFAEPEVSHFDVSSVVYQEVFRLQISVDQLQEVQILKRQQNLRGIEASAGFSAEKQMKLQCRKKDNKEDPPEASGISKMMKHFTPRHKLKGDVQIAVVLQQNYSYRPAESDQIFTIK